MSNNEMYRLYNEMMKGYKENQDGLFEHAVRCWMDLNPENPFPEEDPAYEEFFLMKKGYSVWKMGNADRKINRRRMLEHAKALCALNPKRPYRFDKKEEEAKKAAEAVEEARKAEEAAKLEAEKAEAERREALIKNETRQFNDDFNKHIFGVVEQPEDEEEQESKKGFLGRFFKK